METRSVTGYHYTIVVYTVLLFQQPEHYFFLIMYNQYKPVRTRGGLRILSFGRLAQGPRGPGIVQMVQIFVRQNCIYQSCTRKPQVNAAVCGRMDSWGHLSVEVTAVATLQTREQRNSFRQPIKTVLLAPLSPHTILLCSIVDLDVFSIPSLILRTFNS